MKVKQLSDEDFGQMLTELKSMRTSEQKVFFNLIKIISGLKKRGKIAKSIQPIEQGE